MRLAIAQMLSGVLVVILSSLMLAWGFPTSFTTTAGLDSDGAEIIKQVFINPGPEQMRVELFVTLVLVLGLVVCGIGIVQYVKARRRSRA